jgi:hypothetical protein
MQERLAGLASRPRRTRPTRVRDTVLPTPTGRRSRTRGTLATGESAARPSLAERAKPACEQDFLVCKTRMLGSAKMRRCILRRMDSSAGTRRGGNLILESCAWRLAPQAARSVRCRSCPPCSDGPSAKHPRVSFASSFRHIRLHLPRSLRQTSPSELGLLEYELPYAAAALVRQGHLRLGRTRSRLGPV